MQVEKGFSQAECLIAVRWKKNNVLRARKYVQNGISSCSPHLRRSYGPFRSNVRECNEVKYGPSLQLFWPKPEEPVRSSMRTLFVMRSTMREYGPPFASNALGQKWAPVTAVRLLMRKRTYMSIAN